MQKPVKKDTIQYKSADKKTMVSGYIYTNPEVEPWCALQLSHGMCEYIGRYEDFAAFLNLHGIAVCGNDHLGHGNSVLSPDEYGFFTEKSGWKYVLADLKRMNEVAHKTFPGLPVILLGHSMGSFYARKYAATYPDTIQGLVISGTGGPNALVSIAIALSSLIAKCKGERHRSPLIKNMAFGTYLKNIENPLTEYDWISRDKQIVAEYAKDAKCTFWFTANGYHELFSILREVSSKEWANAIQKDMPVLLISGDADPVGDYGKGVRKVHEWLSEAGVKQLELKMYPGARHEVLNETNRDEVYHDVLLFLEKNWKQF